MDDIRVPGDSSNRTIRSNRRSVVSRRAMVAGLGVSLLSSQTGCSMFVMAGKVLFGDPVMNCEFTQSTGTNLVKTRDKVMVVASAPAAVAGRYPSLSLDIQDGVTRRLSRKGIETVNSDDVSSWADDHGGVFEDLDQLATDFDANYIIEVDVHQFRHFEENSTKLYRGHAQADITVYKVSVSEGQSQALPVFSREYTTRYPKNYAVSVDEKSEVVFQKEYLDRVTHEIAMRFYNHRMSEEVE